MSGGENQAEEAAARPVRGAGTGVVLEHRRKLVIPSARQQPIANRSALDEVSEHAAGDPANFARRERCRVQQCAGPQRGYCSDPVGQRASVVERGAVSAKKESELFQVAEGALTV